METTQFTHFSTAWNNNEGLGYRKAWILKCDNKQVKIFLASAFLLVLEQKLISLEVVPILSSGKQMLSIQHLNKGLTAINIPSFMLHNIFYCKLFFVLLSSKQ
jgi:hypothetical protein